jgi:hypothetical protein
MGEKDIGGRRRFHQHAEMRPLLANADIIKVAERLIVFTPDERCAKGEGRERKQDPCGDSVPGPVHF